MAGEEQAPEQIVVPQATVPVPEGLPLGMEESRLESIWDSFSAVWDYGVFGVDMGKFGIALVILMVFLAIRRLFTRMVLKRLERYTARTTNKLDETLIKALREPVSFVPVVLGVFFAFDYLDLRGTLAMIGNNITRSLIIILLFWGFYRMVEPLSFLLGRVERVFTSAMVSWLIKAIKVLIAFLGAATILELWGIEIGPILAGLGLFGVAVALGAQDLFKNLIAGLLILVERRFSIGDWVRVDGVVEGTVESIGFRSTSIRRFDLAPVYVPNAQMSDGAVTNFSRMTHRRVYWVIGVEYRTTVDQLKFIRDEIERYIVESGDFVPKEKSSLFVRIDSFNASSIDILLYCFADTRAWGRWLEIKEQLAYRIMNIIKESGTGFAFPSQSLYIESLPGETPEPFSPPAGDGVTIEGASPVRKAASKKSRVKKSPAKSARRKS